MTISGQRLRKEKFNQSNDRNEMCREAQIALSGMQKNCQEISQWTRESDGERERQSGH